MQTDILVQSNQEVLTVNIKFYLFFYSKSLSIFEIDNTISCPGPAVTNIPQLNTQPQL